MIVELIPPLGGSPIRVVTAQLVVMNNNGTPIAVAGEFGPDGAVKIATVSDSDFINTLRAFGYGQHRIVVSPLELGEPPAGSKLLTT